MNPRWRRIEPVDGEGKRSSLLSWVEFWFCCCSTKSHRQWPASSAQFNKQTHNTKLHKTAAVSHIILRFDSACSFLACILTLSVESIRALLCCMQWWACWSRDGMLDSICCHTQTSQRLLKQTRERYSIDCCFSYSIITVLLSSCHTLSSCCLTPAATFPAPDIKSSTTAWEFAARSRLARLISRVR